MYEDLFTHTQLIRGLAKAPYEPTLFDGLFTTERLPGTQFLVGETSELAGEILVASARGMPGQTGKLGRDKGIPFVTEHYRKDSGVYADEVLNVKNPFSPAARESLIQRRDKVIAKLRKDIDTTLRYLRLQTLITPNNDFGSKPADTTIAFQTDLTKTRVELFEKLIKPIEDALGGLTYSGIDFYASDGIWSLILGNKAMNDTYIATQNARALTGNPVENFVWGGVNFIRMRGTGQLKVPDNKAIVVPRGVDGMFLQAFAPADTLDQVGEGKLGDPYYVQSYPIEGNRGWRIEVQSNPKMLCTLPQAIFTVVTA